VIDRHEFMPDTVWVSGDDGWLVPLRRADDPDAWMALCRSDEPIITQVDDGNPADGKGFFPTSSSTKPSIMRAMIQSLDLQRGCSVLEIGTGTGFNSAWIEEIVGPGNVVSIEIDSDVAEHARKALSNFCSEVRLIVGDGALGCPEHAPYDRVIATAATHRIPYTWIEQTNPGGLVLVPWSSTYSAGGALLPLRVGTDGTAHGRFGDAVAFMYLRAQRPESVWWGDDDWAGDYEQITTKAPPPRGAFFEDEDAGFALGVLLPGFTRGRTVNESGPDTLRLSHWESGSWASCTPGVREHTIRQHGPRRLWDEFVTAYEWWRHAGCPGRTRFGLTATSRGQRPWLDSPEHSVPLH
jgi:protein-L-isoaspartate O-methyltransferase